MNAGSDDLCENMNANGEMDQQQNRAHPVPLMAWLILLIQPVSQRLQELRMVTQLLRRVPWAAFQAMSAPTSIACSRGLGLGLGMQMKWKMQHVVPIAVKHVLRTPG